ncbi:hypothetical protein D9757_007584 [Collybiopsis confluens]|uniref:ubiquitinyl hydrolase 1 n=1 Tax=Collybiopsis confluens TaxID=2823264 RepID=A0A8H5M5X1_9AGAR|nr:hypothetical protein D9757_007584 [Collybiopsis confluens]
MIPMNSEPDVPLRDPPSQSGEEEGPSAAEQAKAIEQPPPQPVEITADTNLSELSAAQMYELNQAHETADVHRPLIAEIAPIAELRAEYENGSTLFVQQIDNLESQGYSSIRRTRAVAFAYVEQVLKSSDPPLAVATTLSTLEGTPALLETVGYQNLVFDDFYSVLVQLVRNVTIPDELGNKLTNQTLLEAFQSPAESNSIVVYMRMLTSAQMQLNAENFAPFLFHPELGEPMEVKEFCENFVDAIGKEADHVQMTALSQILRIDISVAYLDGRSEQLDFVKFSPEETTSSSPIVLLYRPGHYDILEGSYS